MLTADKPRIYLWCVRAEGWGTDDVHGSALAQDGTGLAGHLSSNVGYSKHDMGLTSSWKHDLYARHYPNGYELVWLDDPDSDPGCVEALRLNEEKWQREQAAALADSGATRAVTMKTDETTEGE